MSDQVCFITSPSHSEKTALKCPARPQAPASSKAQQDPENALLWAFMNLVEAVDVQSQSAVIKAKALSANACAQERLNDRLRSITWEDVPNAQCHYTEHKEYGYRPGPPTPNGGCIVQKYVKADVWTHQTLNRASIDAANAANAQQNKLRADLQGQMNIMQQVAQVSETLVNSNVNEIERTTEEASSILDMLKALTNKILLHT